MFTQASVLLALATSTSAHMVMGFPPPFVWENSATQQSPLAMSDFPCKQPGGTYAANAVTTWNAGEQQTVSFIGGATHGGGSCQFSITTDTKPTKNSQWKVIESVIGGCPSDAEGNLSGNATDTGSNKYPVTMPKDVPSGQYTFAWTWINKIGNREFYMNCSPIQVAGGTGTKDALAALPDMYVANLDGTCSTSAGQDFVYPNPGATVVQGSKATPGSKFDTTSGCAAINKMGAGNGQIGSPSAPSASVAPGVFAPGASAAPTQTYTPAQPNTPSKPSAAPTQPTTPAQPNTPTQPKPAQSSAAAAPAQPNAPSQPQTPANSSNGNSVPCNGVQDGSVMCIGTSKFGLCNFGSAIPQDLAAGLKCVNNQIVAASKRSINFPRAHLHRRHGSSRLL